MAERGEEAGDIGAEAGTGAGDEDDHGLSLSCAGGGAPEDGRAEAAMAPYPADRPPQAMRAAPAGMQGARAVAGCRPSAA
ncbi:hypothetical protein AcidC75_25090 [Acidisoma sp. C75]